MKAVKTAGPTYSKVELSPYSEYGLDEDLTIGGSFVYKQTWNNPDGQRRYSFDDLSVFARAYLYDDVIEGNSFVVSVQPGLYLPIKAQGEINSQSGLSPSMKLNIGYGADDYYADFALGYEYWRGEDSDRVTTQTTFGYELSDDFTYMAQIFTNNITSNNYSHSGNYDLMKVQSSVLWHANDKFIHQLGLNYDLYGKNTGAGYGFLYSLWYKF